MSSFMSKILAVSLSDLQSPRDIARIFGLGGLISAEV